MTLTKTDPALRGQPLRDTGATLLTMGGVAAAFGVASCCGLPFLLAMLGVSSAWLGGVALLAAPHRPLLLWAAALCLVTAAALFRRRRSAAVCTPGAVCSTPTVRGLTVVGLVAGLALLTIGYLYA